MCELTKSSIGRRLPALCGEKRWIVRCGPTLLLVACLWLADRIDAQTQDLAPSVGSDFGQVEQGSLEARIEALERRVAELEKKLGHLGQTSSEAEQRVAPRNASPIRIQLVEKRFHQADVLAGDTGDRIDFTFVFANGLPKPVRAFAGVVVFEDLFDQEIVRMYLTDSQGVGVDRSVRWDGWIQYHDFTDSHRRLRSIAKSDLKARFLLDKVVYEDESIETFADAADLSGPALTAQQVFFTPTAQPTPAETPEPQEKEGGAASNTPTTPKERTATRH